MMSRSITLIVLIAGVLPASLGQLQRAVLYDQYNGEGSYVVIPESYVPDLGTIAWDNKAHSICVTGVWLLYQDINYNGDGPRGMEYVFGHDNFCVNIRTIAGTVSSLRYAGDPKDYTLDSFTLYQFDYFQGLEEYTLRDLANINLVDNHQSVIITGLSDWTVYDQPNFQGNSICLKLPDNSEPGTPAFHSNLESHNPPIPRGTIRSVRKGCLNPGNTVTLESFARGRQQFTPRQLV